MSAKQKKALIRIIIATVLVVTFTIVFKFVWTEENKWTRWIQLVAYLIPYVIVGGDIVKGAVKNIAHGQVFDEKFLMAIATIGAFVLGENLEGVAVMLFYQIGELFQSIAVGKSRKNISDLMDICPDTANLQHEDGSVTEEDPDDIEIGSIIVVNPGEKIPIDGIIKEGKTSLDTSALTGESVPRNAEIGDQVYSGAICLSGQIKLETTKEFGESTASKILELVENSSMKKAKAENFISKFAKFYTPIVVYSALVLALLPPVIRLLLGMDADWIIWITRALTFLVISCPCAVVISVPLSFFGGIGSASSHGILVKGSNYLEVLADVKTIVLDKTGTLTKGVFQVVEISPANGIAPDELLKAAAYAESASSHPIALSIRTAYEAGVSAADVKGLTNDIAGAETLIANKVSDIEEVAGHGVHAKVDGKLVAAGNAKLMVKDGISFVEDTNPGTVVYVAIDGSFAGSIVIADVIKSTSKAAMSGLRSQGIQTVMLTGDREVTAASVAKEIGLDSYRSELLPADKVSEVEKLLDAETGKDRLAFVGDGINDAPVLARADIGIAMGGMGSDAAIEAADVVLMDDDPAKISLAMRISRKTLGIVRQNITFAIGVKVLCLILGALGIANMWVAIFADVGVMVLCVLNATRCLRVKTDGIPSAK